MGRIRIGVSGWRYAPWRGNFYPKKLAQARELEYASRIFSSIELNGSFYSLQAALAAYAQWARTDAAGLVFAVKGSRYITHMLRLRNVETAMANFIRSRACSSWANKLGGLSCGSFTPLHSLLALEACLTSWPPMSRPKHPPAMPDWRSRTSR